MSEPTQYMTASGKVRWEIRYRKPDHKPTRKRGFLTKRDAADWWARAQVSMLGGTYTPPSAGRMGVTEAAAEWLRAQQGLSPTTYERYRGIAEGIIPKRFGNLALNQVTPPLVRQWVDEQVDAGTAAETVHKQVGVLRRVFNLAVDDGRIPRNPALGVRLPAIEPEEMQFLTLAELRRLADAAGDAAPAVMVLGICGLRMGELIGLRHGDVDRAAGLLHVARNVVMAGGKRHTRQPKSKKGRAVPLPPSIAAMLPQSDDPKAPVFTAPGGGLIDPGNWRTRVFAPAVEKAKVAPTEVTSEDGTVSTVYDLHPHELRHTAASLAIARGANIKKVQAMLGHKRATLTLDRYGHLYPSDVADLTGELEAMLTEATSPLDAGLDTSDDT